MHADDSVSQATLSVPHNASAPPAKLLLAPEWLFSHFPYAECTLAACRLLSGGMLIALWCWLHADGMLIAC